MKEKQQQQDIATKAAALNSVGGQSQYRSVASLQLHMKNALSRLEEALLLLDSPDDPIFAALSPVREDISKAIAEADERLSLIVRADADPKIGWRALSIYESKQKASKLDSEKEKVFTSCLKEVQEEVKKKSGSHTYGKKPFRQGPSGFYSGGGYRNTGASRYSNDQCHNCRGYGHWARNCTQRRDFRSDNASRPKYHRQYGFNDKMAPADDRSEQPRRSDN